MSLTVACRVRLFGEHKGGYTGFSCDITDAVRPGEFPTGPSITFAPDSDIAIRDGEAAIEFRSCYAGRAACSSP